ncbi:phosphoglycolate phosphatase [Gymnodinialimonas sp. 2305UL16-5]|uniref:phosphoglycolate phosphatase n=1 Tax=Gymnodinialimonas mytili TaxID=3126503 RepID=UPI00309B09F0
MARIVFDLDGTLIDSAPDIQFSANFALEVTDAAPLSLSETRSFVGSGVPIFVDRMMRARGLTEGREELIARFLEAYQSAVHQTIVFEGVRDTLADLAAAGHVLGICTNKPIAATRAVLAHLDLAAPFATVFGGDSLPQRKPDPAPLRAVFAQLGAGPCLYVGDSEIDVKTAERAGVPFALYTEGYRSTPLDQLTHVIRFDDWARLPGLIAEDPALLSV